MICGNYPAGPVHLDCTQNNKILLISPVLNDKMRALFCETLIKRLTECRSVSVSFKKIRQFEGGLMSKQREEKAFKYVKYLWDDNVADHLEGLDRLVYRSNKLGEDLTLTNTGGGNTSSKLTETDPLTQEAVEALWVKGSGVDLRTARRDGFASLYLDKIRAMKPTSLNSLKRGPKTEIEDAMYPMYSHC